MEKLLISFIKTVATVGILYLGGLLMFELFKMFGVVSILVSIAFIGVWIVWYLISDEL